MATITERLAHLETLRAEALAELAEVNEEIENVIFFMKNDDTASFNREWRHREWLAKGRKRQLQKELTRLAKEIEITENHIYPPVVQPRIR